MLCIHQNQNNQFNGQQSTSSSSSVNATSFNPDLDLPCDEDFNDIKLNDFPIDVPLDVDDSLDQMFSNHQPFDPSVEPVRVESGYSTTGTTTPEAGSRTSALGFRGDGDDPHQSSQIGSTETSMSSAPTTPSSTTLPSFMEIYSPLVKPSRSTRNGGSSFKFDQISLEQDCTEDSSMSDISFASSCKKVQLVTTTPATVSTIEATPASLTPHLSFLKHEAIDTFDTSSTLYDFNEPNDQTMSPLTPSYQSSLASFTPLTSHQAVHHPATIYSSSSPSPTLSSSSRVNCPFSNPCNGQESSSPSSPSSLTTTSPISRSSCFQSHIATSSLISRESTRSYTDLTRSSTSSPLNGLKLYETTPRLRTSSTTSSSRSSLTDLSPSSPALNHQAKSQHQEDQRKTSTPVTTTSHHQHQTGHQRSASSSSSSSSPATSLATTASATVSIPSLQQLCAVCGDNAACQHYGVRTCEGCKGFFKRTVQKGSKYVCLGNRDCPVDKRRRNRCQFCRFQKCLAVGMVKEVVRTDNLKGRRGRLPSKPKSPQESPPSPPVSTITALVRAHVDTLPDYLTKCSEVDESPEMMSSNHQQLVNLLIPCLEVCRNFGEKIPGFNELDRKDQDLLFFSSCLELFTLRFVYQNKPGSSEIILPSGTILDRSQASRLLGDWFNSLESFSQRFNQIDIDISAFACLSGLSLISVRHGLKDPSKVEQVQMKIIESLRDHCTYNSEAQKKAHYFSSILSKLPDLRSLTMEGLTYLHGIKMESMVPIPDTISRLFSTGLYF